MLILITGGSKNGKSRLAESIICRSPLPRIYIATMEPYCDESRAAIERHRKIRSGKGFETIEKYTDTDEIELTEKSAVLLECACNLCANEMFAAGCEAPAEKICRGIKKLLMKSELLVVVTNQVGNDGFSYPDKTDEYIRNMGRLNGMLSQLADCVIETVYGIPLILKGELLL